jgi:hypothetical protein
VSHCYSVLKLKYSTIKFYLAGVCHFSLSIFNHNPLIDTYCCSLKRLENIMTGVKKSGDNLSNQKLPITYDVLCRLNYHFSSVIVNSQLFIRTNSFVCLEKFDNNTFSEHVCFWGFKTNGNLLRRNIVMSLTVRLEEGSNVCLQVNSPHRCMMIWLRPYVDGNLIVIIGISELQMKTFVEH